MTLAAVFPGQGSQKVGMAVALAGKWPGAMKRFNEASEVLGYDLLKLCAEGPEEELTGKAQAALYVSGYATWEILSAAGLKPAFMAGHSLGEYTACAAAGALTFSEGIRLVKARMEAMASAAGQNPGGMLAVLGAKAEDLASWLEKAGETGLVVPANENSPGQVVLSGDPSALSRVEELAKAASVKAIRLKVAGAFHSPLMAAAAEVMKPVLAGANIKDPALPVVGNVAATVLTGAQQVRQELELQLVSPVKWEACVRAMASQGVDTFIEAGPGKVLCGLIKRIDRGLKPFDTDGPAEIEAAIAAVKGG